jgi:hypothetical protein
MHLLLKKKEIKFKEIILGFFFSFFWFFLWGLGDLYLQS